ncbi:MAG TPA: MerR family DNA-binding protein [Cryptosporangiaceae bacterium]|nr:MerR family DNA-binding protein [Cryptosporangiaceae bacterium]
MRTGEVAAQAAVNAQTLRYYERRGLLAEPVRSPGGYRAYPEDAVRRVRFIKRAQELGFSLAEVETMLHLAEGGPDNCDGLRVLATAKIADLEQRINDLRAIQDALSRLVATCEKPRAERECPILREIDPGVEAGPSAAARTGSRRKARS